MLLASEYEQEKEIKELYCDKKLSYKEVGKRLGVSPYTIFRKVRELGFPIRNHKEAMRYCNSHFRTGENNSSWTGGRHYTVHGYVLINMSLLSEREKDLFKPMFADGDCGRVREHRLVVARKLGRPLKTSEIVHHLNGIKDDNRLENLLLSDKAKHRQVIPIFQNRIKELEERLKIYEST